MVPRARTLVLLSFLGAGVLAAAQTPRPALLVLEKGGGSMAIVDPASLKVVARVPVGEDPHEIVTSEDGRLAYVSNYGAFGRPSPLRTISIVDLDAQKTLAPVDLSPLAAPHGLDMAGGKLYFTAEPNKVVGTYDPSTGEVDWVLGTGQDRTHMVLVSKDRSQIFTTNVNSGTVSIIERRPVAGFAGRGRGPAPLDWTSTTVAVGRGAEGFDLSPDGSELWVANAQDRSVSIIDPASRRVTQTVVIAASRANRLKFTPDGRLVLISDPAGTDLVVLDAASRAERTKVPVGRGAGGILVAPGGARAFVALGQENAVVVIDLRNLTVTDRIATGTNPDGLAWAERRSPRRLP
jgi:YVTN family beta-propeller protein